MEGGLQSSDAVVPKNRPFPPLQKRGTGHRRQNKVGLAGVECFVLLRDLQSPPFLKGDLGGFCLSVSPASPTPIAQCPISLDLQKLGQGISIGRFRPHRSALFHQRGG